MMKVVQSQPSLVSMTTGKVSSSISSSCSTMEATRTRYGITTRHSHMTILTSSHYVDNVGLFSEHFKMNSDLIQSILSNLIQYQS